MVFFPKTHNPGQIRRKTLRLIQMEGYSTKYLTSIPQTVMVMKNKERLRNCHRPEDTRRHDNKMQHKVLSKIQKRTLVKINK